MNTTIKVAQGAVIDMRNLPQGIPTKGMQRVMGFSPVEEELEPSRHSYEKIENVLEQNLEKEQLENDYSMIAGYSSQDAKVATQNTFEYDNL